MYFEGAMPRPRPINAFSSRSGVAVIASVLWTTMGSVNVQGGKGRGGLALRMTDVGLAR